MSNIGDRLVAEAAKQIGKRYVLGTQGPDTFDCSGLVYYVVLKVTGQTISRTSCDQIDLGTPVTRTELRPGDILCYDSEGNGGAGHVGIYESPGKMINALNETTGVLESDPFSHYFAPIYLGARRLFPYDDGTAAPPEPSHRFTMGATVKVTEALNLRVNASTSAAVIATLPASTSGTVNGGPKVADGYTWWYVQTSMGTGWAAEDWLIAASAPAPTPPAGKFQRGDDVRTNDTGVRLRTAPTLSGGIVGTLELGQRGTVLDGPRSGDGYTWWQLRTTLGIGWAAENWLVINVGEAPQAKFQVDERVRVTEEMNFRAAASTSATVIGTLQVNAVGTVIGGPSAADGYNWYQLRTALGTGWAAENWLTKSGSIAPSPIPPDPTWTHVVTNGPLNFRTDHTTTATVIASLANGVRLHVVSGPVSAEGYTWYQVTAEGFGTGWCVNGFDPI